MMYSELSNISDPPSDLKIELISYALCRASMNSIQYLNIADIKDILGAVGDTAIREDFGDNALKALSVECPICAEQYPRSRMENMYLCDHVCCLDCTKGYYRTVIKEIGNSEALAKLACFEQHVPIAEDVKLGFFQYIGSKVRQQILPNLIS